MVCRIFTAENYAHRASVEDVVSNDKPLDESDDLRRIETVSNIQDPYIIATPRGFKPNRPSVSRCHERRFDPMSSPTHPIEPVQPIKPVVKLSNEPPAQHPTQPPLVPPVNRPTLPPLKPPLDLPTQPPLTPPLDRPTQPPLTPPNRPTQPPLVPPINRPTLPPLAPPLDLPTQPPLTPPIKQPG
jgi:hypothetical protein